MPTANAYLRRLALALPCILALTQSGAAADTVDIPVVDSLTGYGAFIGNQANEALKLVAGVVNKSGGVHGKNVTFSLHDDQTVPQTAVQLTSAIAAEHPALLLGSSITATCNAMAPLVAKTGPVMYCFSPGIHPAAGSYVFSAGASTLDLAQALLTYFRLRGWTNLALITTTDATGQDADEGFTKLLAKPENSGIKIIEHVHFNTNDVTVSAQVERVRAAKAQAAIVWSSGSPTGTMFRGIVQDGLNIPIGTTSANMTYSQMKQFGGFLPKELYVPAPEWPVAEDPRFTVDPAIAAKQKDLIDAYAAAGLKPDEGSMLAWDPAIIFIDALRKLPENPSAEQLRDYLANLENQPGASGMYNFKKVPQRGLSLDNVIVTRWNGTANRWDVVAKPTGIPIDNK